MSQRREQRNGGRIEIDLLALCSIAFGGGGGWTEVVRLADAPRHGAMALHACECFGHFLGILDHLIIRYGLYSLDTYSIKKRMQTRLTSLIHSIQPSTIQPSNHPIIQSSNHPIIQSSNHPIIQSSTGVT